MRPFRLSPTRIVIFAASGLLLGLLFFAWHLWSEGVFESEAEQIQKLTSAIIPDNSIVLDRSGQKIGEYYSLFHIQVPFQSIPTQLIDSVLAIEDRKFFEHVGVNWRSMGRAALQVLTSGRFKQGGSTITMQLVKNYLLTREKKVSRKIREIVLAYYVEKNLSKERILELYLNTMYLGHGAYGVGAASVVYFGRPLSELSLAEHALLAGLFQAPSAYDPHKSPKLAIKRQQIVLQALETTKKYPRQITSSARQQSLIFKPWTPVNETIAPFFISWIRGEVETILDTEDLSLNDQGLKITTTLDRSLQLCANEAINQSTPSLLEIESRLNRPMRANSQKNAKSERMEAALLATDSKSGAILAMVGGRNFRESQFNRAVSMKRSPGSAFKPVVYSIAMERGLTWSDMVFVSPIDVAGFRPKNHKGDDLTEVTLIKSLAKSMNTPAVSLAQKFGISKIIERAKSMGVKSQLPNEAGIALGGFGATMLDVDSIYRTIANQGNSLETYAITRIEDRNGSILYELPSPPRPVVSVFSESTTALLRSGLQAVLTHGTASALGPMSTFAAGKTGTSDDAKDNWFAGFTKDIVVTTWVGGDQNSSLGDAASGAALALPIWRTFMNQAIAQGLDTSPWQDPSSLVAATIDPDFGSPSAAGVRALFPIGKAPKKSQATDDMKTLKQDNGSYRELRLGE